MQLGLATETIRLALTYKYRRRNKLIHVSESSYLETVHIKT